MINAVWKRIENVGDREMSLAAPSALEGPIQHLLKYNIIRCN